MKYRIHSWWDEFRRKVMSANAPPIQLQEMRRAFYAGIQCCLDRMAGEMTDGDSLEDPADERVVLDIRTELLEFAHDIANGKA